MLLLLGPLSEDQGGVQLERVCFSLCAWCSSIPGAALLFLTRFRTGHWKGVLQVAAAKSVRTDQPGVG